MDSEWKERTIFVVDDKPHKSEDFAEYAANQGLPGSDVPGRHDALNAATENPPDLDLLNIKMPDMDGFELCRHLKADTALRPYKPAFSHEKSYGIIMEGAGQQFDPQIIDAFQALESEFARIRDQLDDT